LLLRHINSIFLERNLGDQTGEKINLAVAKGFVKAPNCNLQHSAKVTNLIIHINFRASRAAALGSIAKSGAAYQQIQRANHSKMLSQLQRNTIINETSMAITNATADTQGAAPDLSAHAGGGLITNSSDQIFPQRAVWPECARDPGPGCLRRKFSINGKPHALTRRIVDAGSVREIN
jgi:hypothetical protein